MREVTVRKEFEVFHGEAVLLGKAEVTLDAGSAEVLDVWVGGMIEVVYSHCGVRPREASDKELEAIRDYFESWHPWRLWELVEEGLAD